MLVPRTDKVRYLCDCGRTIEEGIGGSETGYRLSRWLLCRIKEEEKMRSILNIVGGKIMATLFRIVVVGHNKIYDKRSRL